MKNTSWYVIMLIAGAILFVIGLSQTLSPVPTAPTCDGQQMTRSDVCDRTINGFKTRYNYDEKLQLDIDSHNAGTKNKGWFIGLGIILMLIGIYSLSVESKRRRAASSMSIYPPTGRPPMPRQR